MLRRITLSLALAASIGVASAQLVPNVSWSQLAPRDVPTIEWSSTGTYVLLTTNSAVEVLNGKTLAVLWSRQINSTQPPTQVSYGNDRAHFTSDGLDVWARMSNPNTFVHVSAGGNSLGDGHTFADWGTTQYLLQPVGTELVAYNVTDSGGNWTLNYKIYASISAPANTATFSGTLTHSDGGGKITSPTFSFGVRTGAATGDADVLTFFNQGIYTNTGATWTNPAPAPGDEAWTVAVDASGGMLESVMSSPTGNATAVGSQRIDPSGATTWTSGSLLLSGPITSTGTGATSPGTIAMMASGNNVNAFDYSTGNTLWSDQIINNAGSSLAAFTFSGAAASPANGDLLTVTGTANFATSTLENYVAGSTGLATPAQVPAVIYGIADIAPIPGGGVLIDGNQNFLGSNSELGVPNWSAVVTSGPGHPVASPAGDMATVSSGSTVDVINTSNGSANASYADTGKTPVGTAWVSESEFIVVNADATWDLISLSAGSTSLVRAYPASITGAFAVTSDAHWFVGFGSSGWQVFDLTGASTTPTTTPYSNYPVGAGTARFVPTNNGGIASLELNGSNGLKWSIYTISAGVPSLSKSFTYTAPFTPAAGAQMMGDISSDMVVAAYWVSNPTFSVVGKPTSELAIVRLSDGKVLTTYDNTFTYLPMIRFSADRSVLYALQGGLEPDRGVTSEESGPQDLLTINVPAWILSAVFSPTSTVSGMTSTLTVTLSSPSSLGQKVNLAYNGGSSGPPSFVVSKGLSARGVVITAPIISSTTVCSVSCSIPNSTDPAISANLTVTVPTYAGVLFAPNSLTMVAGTTVVGTVRLTGYTVNPVTVSLTDTDPNMAFPATVTIPADSRTANFNLTPQSSTSSETTTFTSTALSHTQTLTIKVTPTIVVGVALDASSVTGGDAVGCTVTINGPAPTGGFPITMSGGSPNINYPSGITIAAGATSVSFDITTNPVNTATTPTITATLGTKSGSSSGLTINPPVIVAASFEEHAVTGGNPATFDVLLSGAMASSTSFTMNSTSTRITVPTSVNCTAGTSFQSFSFATTAGPDATATVTAHYHTSSGSDTVTIYPQN